MIYSAKTDRKATPLTSSPIRMWMVGLGLCLLTVLVLLRLLSHQILSWGKSGREIVPPEQIVQRGIIVDRDGELLAGDHFAYQITATPSSIDSDEARMWIAQQLEILIGLPAMETWQQLTDFQGNVFFRLAEQISLEDGQKIKEAQTAATDLNRFVTILKIH